MRREDNLLAFLVHTSILLAISLVAMNTSCAQEEPPPPPEPDPVETFFEEIQAGLDSIAAETVMIIGVEDSIGAGTDLQRQIFQEIQSRLYELESITILEYEDPELGSKFEELGINPAEKISPDKAADLADVLKTDAMLYASIESTVPDVHFKIYSGETGAVVFADTLQGWVLPVTSSGPDEFDLDLGTIE
ncbi:MAG TPA: hypothetical protein VGB30_05135 [bacterium]|jgi:hypothetical protein